MDEALNRSATASIGRSVRTVPRSIISRLRYNAQYLNVDAAFPVTCSSSLFST